jgi:hypothetical protein
MRFIDATLQTLLGATMHIFKWWLPRAESHHEVMKSIKIMYIHDKGVMFTSIFASKAKLAPKQDAELGRVDKVPNPQPC